MLSDEEFGNIRTKRATRISVPNFSIPTIIRLPFEVLSFHRSTSDFHLTTFYEQFVFLAQSLYRYDSMLLFCLRECDSSVFNIYPIYEKLTKHRNLEGNDLHENREQQK